MDLTTLPVIIGLGFGVVAPTNTDQDRPEARNAPMLAATLEVATEFKYVRPDFAIVYDDADLHGDGEDSADGSTTTFSVMPGAWFGPFDWRVTPFIGGRVGLGIGNTDGHTTGGKEYQGWHTALAWEAGVGVRARVTDSFDLTLRGTHRESFDISNNGGMLVAAVRF